MPRSGEEPGSPPVIAASESWRQYPTPPSVSVSNNAAGQWLGSAGVAMPSRRAWRSRSWSASPRVTTRTVSPGMNSWRKKRQSPTSRTRWRGTGHPPWSRSRSARRTASVRGDPSALARGDDSHFTTRGPSGPRTSWAPVSPPARRPPPVRSARPSIRPGGHGVGGVQTGSSRRFWAIGSSMAAGPTPGPQLVHTVWGRVHLRPDLAFFIFARSTCSSMLRL